MSLSQSQYPNIDLEDFVEKEIEGHKFLMEKSSPDEVFQIRDFNSFRDAHFTAEAFGYTADPFCIRILRHKKLPLWNKKQGDCRTHTIVIDKDSISIEDNSSKWCNMEFSSNTCCRKFAEWLTNKTIKEYVKDVKAIIATWPKTTT